MTEKGSLFVGACPEWIAEVEAFCIGAARPPSKEFLAHFQTCPACRAAWHGVIRGGGTRSIFEGACADRIAELDTFTDSGMASEEFLAHLDVCPACQAVTDMIIKEEAEVLEAFARELLKIDGDAPEKHPGLRWYQRLWNFIRGR